MDTAQQESVEGVVIRRRRREQLQTKFQAGRCRRRNQRRSDWLPVTEPPKPPGFRLKNAH